MSRKSTKFYVRLGGAIGDIGEIKYGFRAPLEAYENIKDELGVTQLTDNASARGVAFGINTPRPPKVRLSGIDPQIGDDESKSIVRFCDPDKLGRVLNGSLNDAVAKMASGDILINSASMA